MPPNSVGNALRDVPGPALASEQVHCRSVQVPTLMSDTRIPWNSINDDLAVEEHDPIELDEALDLIYDGMSATGQAMMRFVCGRFR